MGQCMPYINVPRVKRPVRDRFVFDRRLAAWTRLYKTESARPTGPRRRSPAGSIRDVRGAFHATYGRSAARSRRHVMARWVCLHPLRQAQWRWHAGPSSCMAGGSSSATAAAADERYSVGHVLRRARPTRHLSCACSTRGCGRLRVGAFADPYGRRLPVAGPRGESMSTGRTGGCVRDAKSWSAGRCRRLDVAIIQEARWRS